MPPQSVVELVEKFQHNEDAYRSGHYNEAQLRIEFLDPFFEALGWDVSNRGGAAEAYKDVIHEDAIKVGEGTKAPDYCFRIGGTRKFFVEAKKPAVNIKTDSHSAFQLRRYAWSSKLPLSLLTNFAEFAAYDCRVQPLQKDKASASRVLFYTYEQYLDHWDEIAGTFSKDAVIKGFFDKFVASTKLKKGTAEVDEAFLREIEKWRRDLASNIALRNSGLSQRELNSAVQKTIDRIIFLRICEDRGIETYGQLRDLQGSDNIYQQLCAIFQRADDRYNSGLFHFLPEKDRAELPDTLTLKLRIDDDRLRGILKRLYFPNSPYEFSVLPADILGQVYEQFLGKVIVLSAGHHATVKDKPEVKKAGGVYYTPTFVVEHIVRKTVGALLSEKTPRQVTKLRILDPACGSGSFLIGAYQYLLNYHRDWYLKDGAEKHTDELYRGSGGEWRLTISEKKRILLNNIYGVDIDAQAVEVTKLSLLLKVLEGESEQTLNTTYRLFHERALPDLGRNIKCGNSLIGHDYEKQQMSLLDEEDRYRINAFDWDAPSGFHEIMKAGGFDAVIGNPPWGGDIDKELEYFHAKYPATTQDHTDSFKLFIERGLTLTRAGGFLSMIVPSTLLRQRRIKDARALLLRSRLVELANLGLAVFANVVAPSCIFVAQKGAPAPNSSVTLIEIPTFSNPDKALLLKSGAPSHSITLQQHAFERNAELEFMPPVLGKCDNCVPLGRMPELQCKDAGINYQRVRVGMRAKGNSDLADRLLYEGKRQKAADQMYWKGSDINRYWMAGSTPRFCRPNYKDFIRKNEVVHLNIDVYDTVPKILLRQTADSLITTVDYKGVWFGRSIIAILLDSEDYKVEYFVGLLNSRYLNSVYHRLVNEEGRTFAQVKLSKIKQLPIRRIDFDIPKDTRLHNGLVDLVESRFALQASLLTAKTEHERTVVQRDIEAKDRQIDMLVYELYDLTSEEIAIIEGSCELGAAIASEGEGPNSPVSAES